MGYAIYWKAKRKFTKEELDSFNKVWNDAYKSATDSIAKKGLSTSHYEWSGPTPMSNKEFEFMKTARIPYDFAIKKALIAVQKISNNGYQITCDDGLQYFDYGLLFDGSGLIEEYKIIRPIRLNLSDLPIIYQSKGKGKLKTGEYAWNEGKKPKLVGVKPAPVKRKLFRGRCGGVFYLDDKGRKVYQKKRCN